jgi:hypothetical protein
VSGVLSAFFAFENSNGTPGEEIVSIVIGLAVAIGLWGFLELRIKRRIERLKSAIDRAMLQMADPTAPSGDEDESASQSHSSPTDCG